MEEFFFFQSIWDVLLLSAYSNILDFRVSLHFSIFENLELKKELEEL